MPQLVARFCGAIVAAAARTATLITMRRISLGNRLRAQIWLLRTGTRAATQLQCDGIDQVKFPEAQVIEGVTGGHQQLQYDGIGQVKFPGVYSTEGVTGMLHPALTGIGIGDFTATKLRMPSGKSFKERQMRTHGDVMILMTRKVLPSAGGSENRRSGNHVPTNGGGDSIPLGQAPTMSIEAKRMKADSIVCGTAHPRPMYLPPRPRGSCRGSGGLHGNTSHTSGTTLILVASTRLPTPRRLTAMSSTPWPTAPVAAWMHDALRRLQWAKHLRVITSAMFSISVLRTACMQGRVSWTKGLAERPPAEFEGGYLRLGGNFARLQHMQAPLGHPQFVGKQGCLGRSMLVGVLPVARIKHTLGERCTSVGDLALATSVERRNAWIVKMPPLPGPSPTTQNGWKRSPGWPTSVKTCLLPNASPLYDDVCPNECSTKERAVEERTTRPWEDLMIRRQSEIRHLQPSMRLRVRDMVKPALVEGWIVGYGQLKSQKCT